jgi:Tetratricopeptide repeat
LRSLIALGGASYELGEAESAIESFKDALTLSRKLGDTGTAESALNMLGKIHEGREETGAALAYYGEALKLARQAGEDSATADTLFKMGRLALAGREPEQAQRFLSESVRLYSKLNSPAAAQVSTLLGDLETFRGEAFQLVETARRFFGNAGITLALIPGKQIFRCEFAPASFKSLPQPVFVRFLHGEELDDERAREIREQVLDLDGNASVVFVVTNARPTDSGWAQIGTFRLGGSPFSILPVESVLLNEGLTTGRERALLRTEIEKRISGSYDPYFVSYPVADAFSFFGRDGLVNTLLRRLSEGQPVGVFGLRKLGKSSVLKALYARAPFPVANVNLQTVWSDPLEQLLARVAESWRQWLRIHYDLSWEPPALAASGAAGSFVAGALDLLNRIERERGAARRGILFDEIEVIVPKADGKGTDLGRYLTLMRALRGLIDQDGRLSLAASRTDRRRPVQPARGQLVGAHRRPPLRQGQSPPGAQRASPRRVQEGRRGARLPRACAPHGLRDGVGAQHLPVHPARGA